MYIVQLYYTKFVMSKLPAFLAYGAARKNNNKCCVPTSVNVVTSEVEDVSPDVVTPSARR